MLLSWEQGSFQGDEQDCNHRWTSNSGCPQSQACWGVQDVSGISESLPVGTWKRLSSLVAFQMPSPGTLCGENKVYSSGTDGPAW